VALYDKARATLPPAGPVMRAVPIVLMGASLAFNSWVYFVEMYTSPAVWGRFAPVGTQLATGLRNLRATGTIAPGTVLLAPEAFVTHPDELHVMRFLVPDIEVRAFESPGPAPRTGELVVIPNYKDLWRHVAGATPRYAPRAEQAALDHVAWRRWLDSLTCIAVQNGPSFPATQDPSFWLYLVTGPTTTHLNPPVVGDPLPTRRRLSSTNSPTKGTNSVRWSCDGGSTFFSAKANQGVDHGGSVHSNDAPVSTNRCDC
jgi:hypothetical protein